uniref:RING-type E3 ubiquitin transferase n=1 Tax=Oryza meridionalis TaxID=40149 RepID=A0A0E0F7Q3_9ORYZ
MVAAAAATAVAVAHTLVFWLNRNSQVAFLSPYLLKSQDLAERILSLEADLNRQSENTLKEKEEHEKTRTELEVKEKQLEEERQNHTLTVQRHGEELERQSRELERQREELERQGRELKMKDGKLNRMKTLTIVDEKFRQWIEGEASNSSSGFTEFSHSEVDDSIPKDQKYHLGKGSYGIVYKAEPRGKTVAMKILDKSSWQGEREFKQEVGILKRIRHPNLVILLGACSEKFALMYEFLPSGTLEDCLSKEERKESFSWEEKNVCKLSDFGISRLLQHSTDTVIPNHITEVPKGSGPYMDPEFMSTGKLTQSDVFALGIILLQLVTGQSATGLRKHMVDKLERQNLGKMDTRRQKMILEKLQILDDKLKLDDKFIQDSIRMLSLGLRCSYNERKRRPNLEAEVWPEIESMNKSECL